LPLTSCDLLPKETHTKINPIPFFEEEALSKYKNHLEQIIKENGYGVIDFRNGEYFYYIEGVSPELKTILEKV
jgi:hypothetical protein